MAEQGMGRLPEFDPRSLQYRAVSPVAEDLPLKTKTWRRGQAYDQGATSQCVAYTGKGILNTSPESAEVAYDVRSRYSTQEFYNGAQRLDQWEGENYEGTSALGLGKYLLSQGLITVYEWCFGLNHVLHALSHEGPVGIGVNWYSGMMRTDASGYVNVTGSQVGGHEVELIGLDLTKRHVIGMNSWGTGWGMNGRFYLRWDDLDRLLHEQGDAVVLR